MVQFDSMIQVIFFGIYGDTLKVMANIPLDPFIQRKRSALVFQCNDSRLLQSWDKSKILVNVIAGEDYKQNE